MNILKSKPKTRAEKHRANRKAAKNKKNSAPFFIVLMALIKYSGFAVVDMSGKVGGSVASRNRGGAYMRTWVKPVNPRSIRQIQARTTLTGLSQAFRSLTLTQIASWNASTVNFPKVNRIAGRIKLSGLSLFVSLNTNLQNIGLPPLSVPPIPQDIIGFTSLTLTSVLGVLNAVFTPTPTDATTSTLVYATIGLSPGVNFVKSEYRLIGVIPPATASPHNITAMYTAKFGAPIAGTKIYVELAPVNIVSGQQGQRLAASIIST